MSQNLTFSKAVQQLYYNVNVKNASVDTVISEFKNIADEYHVGKGMSSLSINLDMNTSENAKKNSYIFKFFKSPLPDMVVDTGYIKINIGEVENNKKIIDIEWRFQFPHKTDAEMFFEELKKIFAPISTKQKFGEDELNSMQYAEFSTRNENTSGIKDVTFFLSKSIDSINYEIGMLPFNEFMEEK